MADIEAGEHNLLTTKWGPLPVWAYALILLVLAWVYAKWRASKTTSTDTSADSTGTGDASSETDAVAPQFIIENNLPQPNAPVTTPPPVTTPVVTPPGTTTAPPTNTTPTPPAKSKPTAPVAKKPLSYKVVHGDTLTSIAKKYDTTATALYAYNTTPGVRPAATIKTLKTRGPNLVYAGETILIPQ